MISKTILYSLSNHDGILYDFILVVNVYNALFSIAFSTV